MTPIITAIQESIQADEAATWAHLPLPEKNQHINTVYRRHLDRVRQQILAASATLNRLVTAGDVEIRVGMYDVATGMVDVVASQQEGEPTTHAAA